MDKQAENHTNTLFDFFLHFVASVVIFVNLTAKNVVICLHTFNKNLTEQNRL